MTYARSRLWLGMTGVGTVVTLAFLAVITGFPSSSLPDTNASLAKDALWIGGCVLGFLMLMVPFDLLGGFLLPLRFGREVLSFGGFCRRWFVGVALQSAWFIATGTAILWAGRSAGLGGALVVVAVAGITQLFLQGRMLRTFVTNEPGEQTGILAEVRSQLETWGFASIQLHSAGCPDPGFTGGVVGLPGREKIIIPSRWLKTLSVEQTAAVVARRVEAIKSGSRSFGLAFALLWVLVGFAASTLLPGAGVRSVAELATSCCGFTCWTFLGLLVLPTLSRRACFSLDLRVMQRGISADLLQSALATLDRLQDDEPARPALIETIFHPVPSVSKRTIEEQVPRVGPWHVARTTLFLSWSCVGLLSRAVHCNAGRPELWIMLPTD